MTGKYYSVDMADCVQVLRDLEPKMKAAAIAHWGYDPYDISCTGRVWGYQDLLYLQGRVPLPLINTLRKARGLWILGLAEDQIVTKALDSLHVITPSRPLAEAFDVVMKDRTGKRTYASTLDADNDKIWDYKELAEIGRSIGLHPGMDFGDMPHFEVIA